MLLSDLGNSPAFPSGRWKSPEKTATQRLLQYIAYLENACRKSPESADLQTCLGMAHAKNDDVYLAKLAFENALRLEPEHFFAQLRYAELYCRFGAYPRAEFEAERAAQLARNRCDAAMVRRLSDQIRSERRVEESGRELVSLCRPFAICLAIVLLVAVTLLAR